MAVAEGLTLLALPHIWLRIVQPFMRASRVWGVAMLLVGAFLLSSAVVRPLSSLLS
jgi:hypothetical protein